MEQEDQPDKPNPALNNMMIVDDIHFKNHRFQCEREGGTAFQRLSLDRLKGHQWPGRDGGLRF